jgi:hypothetical protein
LNLLSDAALTAAASSPNGRSSEVVADVQWTDLPLSLIMEYNFYTSCYSDATLPPGRTDGVCTDGAEGITSVAVGDDAGQGEASVFDISRRQWLRRRNDGDKDKEEQIDAPSRGVDWPLRMLCREISSYTLELAVAIPSFMGQKEHYIDAVGGDFSLSHENVELHYTFAMTNVTHVLFHSQRNGRAGAFGTENGVVGKIRQRAMLKQLLVIASEGVIRQILGCSASTSTEEEDGDCDISLFVNSLRKITCQDQYSSGCVSVEMTAYIWTPKGSHIGDLISNNGGDIKSELLRAIEKSVQSGGFEQLMGI